MCVLLFNSRAVWRARTEFVSRFVFSFQIRTQSCGVRDYFVSLSYAFVFSSYPSCVLFMLGLQTSCQFRIQSCGFRVYFVFFSCGFVFSSFCACVSGKFVSNSYPVVRWSCLFRMLFKRFRVQFVTACVLFIWGVKSWCQIRIQLCGVVSFVSF